MEKLCEGRVAIVTGAGGQNSKWLPARADVAGKHYRPASSTTLRAILARSGG
jgi:hypothetical protein